MLPNFHEFFGRQGCPISAKGGHNTLFFSAFSTIDLIVRQNALVRILLCERYMIDTGCEKYTCLIIFSANVSVKLIEKNRLIRVSFFSPL